MKKITLITLFITIGTLLSVNMKGQQAEKPNPEGVENLKAYPASVDSLERHVIFLAQKDSEDFYKVELIAGKMMEADCNIQRLIGEFSEEVVQGWGFTYFKFETEGHVMSTMMACSKPKETRFIPGQSQLTRYNSRLPIVVYLPKGMQLKYKIWSAGEEQTVTKN